MTTGELCLRGVLTELEGKKNQILADAFVYINNAVGVGEHSSICEEFKKKLSELDVVDSQIDTINKYFVEQTPQPGPE
jgi:hypothetical protein